jgi:hypothetical protein
MSRGRLVVHAHFYQPFRVDPFTGRIPDDPSAAPFRNWNERITAECYRPIAELGVPAHISWNLGATLTDYLSREAPAVLRRFAELDRAGGGTGMAQSFHHSILPLASLADRRTEVIWGLRDFEWRFGRRATSMWLPETAVDLATLRVAADAGVTGVVLAPWQADSSYLDARQPYRVDVGGGRQVTAMFYDGELSGAVSFEPAATADADRFARERVAPRLAAPLPNGGDATAVIATDGELYGHHQSFRDLFLQRLVAPGVDAGRSFDVVGFQAAIAEVAGRPHPEMRIRDRTSWSCHHGVLRWTAECPDVPDGRWKGPLRAALERLAGAIDSVTEGVGRELGIPDVWAARDRYVDVIIGAQDGDAFAAACLGRRSSADARARLRTLMEAQRWRLGMFASCGWFWEDPVRIETHQVLRAAARAVRLVDGLAGTTLEPRLLADLGTFRSPSTGMDGASIYATALRAVGQPLPAAPGRRARRQASKAR